MVLRVIPLFLCCFLIGLGSPLALQPSPNPDGVAVDDEEEDEDEDEEDEEEEEDAAVPVPASKPPAKVAPATKPPVKVAPTKKPETKPRTATPKTKPPTKKVNEAKPAVKPSVKAEPTPRKAAPTPATQIPTVVPKAVEKKKPAKPTQDDKAAGDKKADDEKAAGNDDSQEVEAKPSSSEDVKEDDTGKGEDTASTDKKNRTPNWFKKGELASVGSLGLLPWQNRFGSRIDIERLGPNFYLSITPTVNHTLEIDERDLTMSFGVPLRLEILDTRGSTTDERFGNAGSFRDADWDTPQDFVKLIRFLKYGRKEDHFYVNLNAFRTGSIGHGAILRRYNPNLSIDVQRVSLELDAFSDYIGAETYLNDIAHPNLVGGLVFVKPLSLIDRDNYIMRSFSIGATAVVDWDAPMVNKLDTFDADKDGRRGEILLGGDNGQAQYHAGTVVGYGLDIETKFFKSDDKTVDLKGYIDMSFISGQVPKKCANWKDGDDKARCPTLFTNDPVNVVEQPGSIESEWVTSNGFSLGLLGRFTLGAERKHALRLRLELRSYEPNFLPSYFDNFYQVERIQYRNSGDPTAVNPSNQTKLRRILERTGTGRVLGTYFEASYAFWKVFEASLGLTLNSATADNGFFLHLGVPRNEYFSFVMTYYKSTSQMDDLFDLEKNSVFLFQGRVHLLPVLNLYIGAITPFGFGATNEFEQVFDINTGLELSFGY